MYVEHSGWNKQHGAFRYHIFMDETRTDYEIHYQSGRVDKQSSPFQEQFADWNHDDDWYSQFGAWFEHRDEDGNFKGGEFWTPEQLVRELLNTMEGSAPSYGDRIVAVPGIEIPPPEKRPALQDQIFSSERRREAQEIERNRKMNALGIRPSNEPWAR